MKKTGLTALLLIGGCLSGANAHTIITGTCGGGPDGYKEVNESHSADCDALSCEDPGIKKCQWTQAPQRLTTPQLNQIRFSVEEQITNGNLTGRMRFPDGNTISWNASSLQCYKYQIDILE